MYHRLVTITIKINGELVVMKVYVSCVPDTPVKELKQRARDVIYNAFKLAEYEVL